MIVLRYGILFISSNVGILSSLTIQCVLCFWIPWQQVHGPCYRVECSRVECYRVICNRGTLLQLPDPRASKGPRFSCQSACTLFNTMQISLNLKVNWFYDIFLDLSITNNMEIAGELEDPVYPVTAARGNRCLSSTLLLERGAMAHRG